MFNIGDIVTTNGKTVKGRKVIGFIADIQPDASHKYKVIPLNNYKSMPRQIVTGDIFTDISKFPLFSSIQSSFITKMFHV